MHVRGMLKQVRYTLVRFQYVVTRCGRYNGIFWYMLNILTYENVQLIRWPCIRRTFQVVKNAPWLKFSFTATYSS